MKKEGINNKKLNQDKAVSTKKSRAIKVGSRENSLSNPGGASSAREPQAPADFNLQDKIFSNIKLNKLKPHSKRYHLSLKIAKIILSLAVILLVIFILAVSINTFRFYYFIEKSFNHNIIITIFKSVPWLSVILLIPLMIIWFKLITNSEFGYKYRRATIIGSSAVIVMLLANFILLAGIRHRTEDNFKLKAPTSDDLRFSGLIGEVKTEGNQTIIEIESNRPGSRIIVINEKTKCHPKKCQDTEFKDKLRLAGNGQDGMVDNKKAIIADNVFAPPSAPLLKDQPPEAPAR